MKNLKRRAALWMAYVMVLTVLFGTARPEEAAAAKKEKVSVSHKSIPIGSEERHEICVSNAKPTVQYIISVDKKGIIEYSVDSFFDYYTMGDATKKVHYWIKGLKPGKVKVTISKKEGKKTKKLKTVSLTVKEVKEYKSLTEWFRDYTDVRGYGADYDEDDYEYDDDDYDEDNESSALEYFREDVFGSKVGDEFRLVKGSKLYLGSFIESYDELDPATIHVTSDDTDVIKIKDNALAAVSVGTANIKVEAEGFFFTAECTVIPDPKDSYSKLVAELEGYKNAVVTKKNYVSINNAIAEYLALEYYADDDDRVLLPISYDVKVLSSRLQKWVNGKCKAVDPMVSPNGLKIKKATVTSSKKVKLTLKSKVTAADMMALTGGRWAQSFYPRKYTSKTKAELFIPMVDKNSKKFVCLTGKVKTGQKTITLKADRTIKKKTPYYIPQLTKKEKKTTLNCIKVVRK